MKPEGHEADPANAMSNTRLENAANHASLAAEQRITQDSPRSGEPPRTRRGAANDPATVFISVSRRRAAIRAVAFFSGSAAIGLVPVSVVPDLQLTPTAVDNRLDEYALLAAMLPLVAAAAALLWRGGLWLALTCWPGRIGVEAGPEALTFALGPFGAAAFDARRLAIRYPFEQVDDPQGGGYEAYLPEEVQRATFLPKLHHPKARRSLRRQILKFAAGNEPAVARRMQGIIRIWRNEPRD